MEQVLRPIVVFGYALAILLPIHVASVYTSGWFNSPPKPVGDGLDYENIAFHLSQGQGFYLDNQNADWREIYEADRQQYSLHLDSAPRQMVATGRPPLFPLLVSFVYRAIGRNELAFSFVRLFSAVCLAVSGALAAYILARMQAESRSQTQQLASASDSNHEDRASTIQLWASIIGIATAIALAASSRTLRSYANDFLTEPLSLLLVQLLLILVLFHRYAPDQPSQKKEWFTTLGRFALAGAVLGLLIMARSIFVVWAPGITLLVFASLRTRWSERLPVVATFAGVALLVCVPWWGRNIAVLERFMPLGTQGPITLLGAYSDAGLAAGGEWSFAPEQELRKELATSSKKTQHEQEVGGDIEASSRELEILLATTASQRVRSWISDHTSDLPRLFGARILTHWNPYFGRSLVWKILIVVGALGLCVPNVRRDFRVWSWGLPLLSTLVAAGLYTTGGRFLVPLYGLLFALAGHGAYLTVMIVLKALFGLLPMQAIVGQKS